MYTFKGVLTLKKDEQVISDKFKKREFVVNNEDPQYPQEIMFQLTQDRCSIINNCNEGDTVIVSFDLRGRSWDDPKGGETKWFNTLNAWRVEVEVPANLTSAPGSETNPVNGNFESDDDDLPF